MTLIMIEKPMFTRPDGTLVMVSVPAWETDDDGHWPTLYRCSVCGTFFWENELHAGCDGAPTRRTT